MCEECGQCLISQERLFLWIRIEQEEKEGFIICSLLVVRID